MQAPSGLHIRKDMVEGVGPWMWRQADHWGWEHPKREFRWLRDAILAHTRERKVIIQAGGCLGMYPRLWADSFEHVYTFEPDPVNFYCLVANCPSERIIKMQAALSDTCRFGVLQPGPDFNAGMGKMETEPGPIPMLALDAMEFPAVDAIQLDCEGHETKIIAGAVNTLRKHHPVVSIEKPDAAARDMLGELGYVEVERVGLMPDVVFAAT